MARSVQKMVRESYGLLPDERLSANQNALIILTTMEKWFYIYQSTNLAFHNFTIGKVAPKALQSLLGLGVDFCPTPLLSTLNIDKRMERFEREMHICSIFAGSEDIIPLANPTIYVRSKYKPPAWYIYLALKRRLQTFRKALEPKFPFRPVRHNLLTHQR